MFVKEMNVSLIWCFSRILPPMKTDKKYIQKYINIVLFKKTKTKNKTGSD